MPTPYYQMLLSACSGPSKTWRQPSRYCKTAWRPATSPWTSVAWNTSLRGRTLQDTPVVLQAWLECRLCVVRHVLVFLEQLHISSTKLQILYICVGSCCLLGGGGNLVAASHDCLVWRWGTRAPSMSKFFLSLSRYWGKQIILRLPTQNMVPTSML